MIMPRLFAYPRTPHQRRYEPSGYEHYQNYKPWLRDEFVFRCVYCLEREMWYPDRAESFSVDHLVPQSEDESLINEYTNLVYACTRCNSARSKVRLLNPLEAAFGEHIRLHQDGLLQHLTPDGQDLIDQLHLNNKPALSVRRKYLRILELKELYPEDGDIDHLFYHAFGFPEDLPDLRTLRPPGGNSRETSEETCYFVHRENGKLPAVY